MTQQPWFLLLAIGHGCALGDLPECHEKCMQLRSLWLATYLLKD